MVAYGKMKRSSMKSINENKSGSQLSRDAPGGAVISSARINHGITHDKSCDVKRNYHNNSSTMNKTPNFFSSNRGGETSSGTGLFSSKQAVLIRNPF